MAVKVYGPGSDATKRMNLTIAMLSQRNKIRRNSYDVIPFIRVSKWEKLYYMIYVGG